MRQTKDFRVRWPAGWEEGGVTLENLLGLGILAGAAILLLVYLARAIGKRRQGSDHGSTRAECAGCSLAARCPGASGKVRDPAELPPGCPAPLVVRLPAAGDGRPGGRPGAGSGGE